MAVEVKLDAIKEDISEIKNAVKNIETNHLPHINAAITKLTQNYVTLSACVDALKEARKRGFSNKEKAVISTTIITAVASIIVAFITQI
jgi:predicted negative regulator of RcsB-dependent stress response